MKWLWLVVASLPLAAGDFTGIWVGRIEARNGEMQDIAFQFRQTGSKLAGKLYGDYQSSPIVDGTVADMVVSFVVRGDVQAGNEVSETRTRFIGRFQENGELELTRERESPGNGGPRLTFRVKRLT